MADKEVQKYPQSQIRNIYLGLEMFQMDDDGNLEYTGDPFMGFTFHDNGGSQESYLDEIIEHDRLGIVQVSLTEHLPPALRREIRPEGVTVELCDEGYVFGVQFHDARNLLARAGAIGDAFQTNRSDLLRGRVRRMELDGGSRPAADIRKDLVLMPDQWSHIK